ncbi:uncharacterized protein LOC142554629 [Primulina tabacum]|uniref:uncharacterized protein LOC142554629 n=1 Tax=Primulina tabacum TaxID=48773 RepID=UPI003F5A28D8
MIVLSWNCRGLGNPKAVPVLRELIKTHTPDIIFLFETLVHAQKLEDKRIKIGYEGCFAVNREGRSGGIGVLWRKSSICQLITFSNNHVDLEILNNDTHRWRLTGFYGYPERHRRKESWRLLKTIAAASNLPWCIVGDFNDLLYTEDKKGLVEHLEWLFRGFRNTINECALQELHLQGYPFTWSRSRGKPNAVEERLDRAFGNSEWMAQFPEAQLINLVAPISDHSPLLLKTVSTGIVTQKRRFRFENKWLKEPDFQDLVQNSWDTGFNQELIPRLKLCSEFLSSWGKQHFAKFKRDINLYKQKLEQLRNFSDPGSMEEHDKIRKKMIDLLVQEEDHWRQRAKSFWLSEEDLNTKFFHSYANARKKKE